MSSPFFYMQEALRQAYQAQKEGEVPVGALIVQNQSILAQTHNQVLQSCDPTAHAEILAIRQACNILQSSRLRECDLYVTLEPCAMCAQALAWSQIRRIYYGAYDPKSGGIDHGARIFSHPTCHHRPELYGGIHEKECGLLLQNFFQQRRGLPRCPL